MSPTNLLLLDALNSSHPPFTAHFDKLKPYRSRIPLCSFDSLPILPPNQIPPIASEFTVSSPRVDIDADDDD
ncbi:unnamed protein product, partial [Dibothriocephalus latus]